MLAQGGSLPLDVSEHAEAIVAQAEAKLHLPDVDSMPFVRDRRVERAGIEELRSATGIRINECISSFPGQLPEVQKTQADIVGLHNQINTLATQEAALCVGILEGTTALGPELALLSKRLRQATTDADYVDSHIVRIHDSGDRDEDDTYVNHVAMWAGEYYDQSNESFSCYKDIWQKVHDEWMTPHNGKTKFEQLKEDIATLQAIQNPDDLSKERLACLQQRFKDLKLWKLESPSHQDDAEDSHQDDADGIETSWDDVRTSEDLELRYKVIWETLHNKWMEQLHNDTTKFVQLAKNSAALDGMENPDDLIEQLLEYLQKRFKELKLELESPSHQDDAEDSHQDDAEDSHQDDADGIATSWDNVRTSEDYKVIWETLHNKWMKTHKNGKTKFEQLKEDIATLQAIQNPDDLSKERLACLQQRFEDLKFWELISPPLPKPPTSPTLQVHQRQLIHHRINDEYPGDLAKCTKAVQEAQNKMKDIILQLEGLQQIDDADALQAVLQTLRKGRKALIDSKSFLSRFGSELSSFADYLDDSDGIQPNSNKVLTDEIETWADHFTTLAKNMDLILDALRPFVTDLKRAVQEAREIEEDIDAKKAELESLNRDCIQTLEGLKSKNNTSVLTYGKALTEAQTRLEGLDELLKLFETQFYLQLRLNCCHLNLEKMVNSVDKVIAQLRRPAVVPKERELVSLQLLALHRSLAFAKNILEHDRRLRIEAQGNYQHFFQRLKALYQDEKRQQNLGSAAFVLVEINQGYKVLQAMASQDSLYSASEALAREIGSRQYKNSQVLAAFVAGTPWLGSFFKVNGFDIVKLVDLTNPSPSLEMGSKLEDTFLNQSILEVDCEAIPVSYDLYSMTVDQRFQQGVSCQDLENLAVLPNIMVQPAVRKMYIAALYTMLIDDDTLDIPEGQKISSMIVAKDGSILSWAINTNLQGFLGKDESQHAEINAIRAYQIKTGKRDLPDGSLLFSSLKSCMMCAQKIRECLPSGCVIYGQDDPMQHTDLDTPNGKLRQIEAKDNCSEALNAKYKNEKDANLRSGQKMDNVPRSLAKQEYQDLLREQLRVPQHPTSQEEKQAAKILDQFFKQRRKTPQDTAH